jgi:hypothetical protein
MVWAGVVGSGSNASDALRMASRAASLATGRIYQADDVSDAEVDRTSGIRSVPILVMRRD